MQISVAGVVLALGGELIIRAIRQQLRGVIFSPLTFIGAVCFMIAVAHAVNKHVYISIFVLTPEKI